MASSGSPLWAQSAQGGGVPITLNITATASVQGAENGGDPVDKITSTKLKINTQWFLQKIAAAEGVALPVGAKLVLQTDTSVIVTDGKGGMAACDTWDNATLLCETRDPNGGATFPWTLKTHRIAPGERNTWYIDIYGTKTSARFSIREPKRFEILEYTGKDQIWGTCQTAYETPFPTITGLNFEFGFPDAFLQMWAAFVHELMHEKPLGKYSGCGTPGEAALSHRLFTAALKSQKDGNVAEV